MLCTRLLQKAIESEGDGTGEPMFLDVVPVGLLHRAAVRRDAGQRSSRPVRSLFVGRRVFVFKDPLHLQAWLQGVAFIEEKKCLAAVSDKDDCGNLMYGFLSGMNASRSCKSLEVEINARLMSRAGSNIWSTLRYDLLFLAPQQAATKATARQTGSRSVISVLGIIPTGVATAISATSNEPGRP